MGKSKFRKFIARAWHFVWEDDSPLSWIVNIILAFVLIKFVVYPVMGLVLATNYPIVAVVSPSMEHNNLNFDKWWDANGQWYADKGITKEGFASYPMRNGFNTGDIIVLRGKDVSKMRVGEVMVFWSSRTFPKPDPIIHRIVSVSNVGDGVYSVQTKGDNNKDSIRNACDINSCIDEMDIRKEQIIGFSIFKIPYLGYIKIWAYELLQITVGGIRHVLS
jgi:signal peptidase I